jgi:hypothetical protein
MKKYRIIKITSYNWEIRYALEHRVLWFLRREKLEIDIDGCFTVYRDKKTAEEVLQQYIWKNKTEIVWEY